MTRVAANKPVPHSVRWLIGLPGVAIAFLWGIAEGSFFVIVPDVFLTLVALFAPLKSLWHAAAIVVGSLLAGIALFLLSTSQPDRLRQFVVSLPYVTEAMSEKVQEDYASDGALALLKGPMSGIPYKLYAVEAPAYISMSAFIAATPPARLERLLITWAIFGFAGWLLHNMLRRHPMRGIAGWAIYWVGIYAFYWGFITL